MTDKDIFASTDELIEEHNQEKLHKNEDHLWHRRDLQGRLAVFKAWHDNISNIKKVMDTNREWHQLTVGYPTMSKIAEQIRRIEEALR